MMNTFSVGVTVHLVDKVSAGMGILANHFIRASGQADVLRQKLGSIKALWNEGSIVMKAGAAIAAPLHVAVDKAAELELAMKRIQMTTMASNEEMARVPGILADISHKTMFSMGTVGDIGKEMAAGGIKFKDIFGDGKKNQGMLNLFGSSAEMLYQFKGVGYKETVHALTGIAHQIGKYSEEEMRPVVEAATKLMMVSPGSINDFKTMGSYMNPKLTRLMKIDPTEILTLQAAAMQTSGGGAGGGLKGPRLLAAVERAMGTFGSGQLTGKTGFALQSLGLIDKDGLSTVVDKNGKFQLSKFLLGMEKTMQQAETASGRLALAKRMKYFAETSLSENQAANELPMINKIISSKGEAGSQAQMMAKLLAFGFGQQGGSALAVLASKEFVTQLKYLTEMLKKQANMEKMQSEFTKQFTPSFNILKTDIETVFALFAIRSLPLLTKIVQGVDSMVGAVIAFERAHPEITQFIFTVVSTLSAFVSGGGLMMMINAAIAGFRFLLPFLAPLWPMIAGIAVAIGIVSVALMNWEPILGWLNGILTSLTQWSKAFVVVLLDTFPGLKSGLTDAVAKVKEWINNLPILATEMAKNWNTIVSGIGQVTNALINMLNSIGAFKIGNIDFGQFMAKVGAQAGKGDTDARFDQHMADIMGGPQSKNIPRLGNHSTVSTYIGNLNIHAPGGHPETVKTATMEGLGAHSRRAARATPTGSGSHTSAGTVGGH